MSNYRYIAIGGSAGSFRTITSIIEVLPADYPLTIFLTLHRLKHIRTGFVEALSLKSKLPIIEPKDKESFYPGKIYLAPANYHMYIEPGLHIALSTEEAVNHSRPAIDLTFKSAAYSLKNKLIGIVLSGANKDGAEGLKYIKTQGGLAVVHDPEECQVKTMPATAIQESGTNNIYTQNQIIDFLLNLNFTKSEI